MKDNYFVSVMSQDNQLCGLYFNNAHEIDAFLSGIDVMHEYTMQVNAPVISSVTLYRLDNDGEYTFLEMPRYFVRDYINGEDEYKHNTLFYRVDDDEEIITYGELLALWEEDECEREIFPNFDDYLFACLNDNKGELNIIV